MQFIRGGNESKLLSCTRYFRPFEEELSEILKSLKADSLQENFLQGLAINLNGVKFEKLLDEVGKTFHEQPVNSHVTVFPMLTKMTNILNFLT